MPVNVEIKTRRGTAAEWASANPVLSDGEPGLETDTGVIKYGDDVSHWDELPAANKQFQNVVTVAKSGKRGTADFRCNDPVYSGSDAACIQAAVDYCAANNLHEIYIGPGGWAPDTQINITTDIKIICSPKTTFTWNTLFTTTGYMIQCSGSLAATLTATADVAIKAQAISVQSTTGIVKGDLIIIYDDTLWIPDDSDYAALKTGEMHEVVSTDDTTIYFLEGLLHNYTVTNNLKVQVIHPIQVELENFKISGIDNISSQIAILLKYCTHSKISMCDISNIGYSSISISECFDVDVSNCYITGSQYTTASFHTGYGVNTSNACAHIRVHDNTILKCTHTVAAGAAPTIGESRDIRVYNNDLYSFGFINSGNSGGGQVVDAHQCVESLYVYNNIIRGSSDHNPYAVNSGAKITNVSGNILYDCYGCTVRGSIKDAIHIIQNNECHRGAYIFYDNSDTLKSNTEKLVVITNNHMFDCEFYIANIQKATHAIIENNTIDGTTNYYGISITNLTNGKISNNDLSKVWRSGITILDSSNVKINDNKITDCCQYNYGGELFEAGISIRGSSNNITIENNIVTDSTGKMRYAIREYGTANNNHIKDNTVSGGIFGQISTVGAGTKVQSNPGYKTENTGTATISASQTSIAVTHNLASTPTRVQLTPTTPTAGKQYHISAKAATTFTITTDSAAEADISFDWSAVV